MRFLLTQIDTNKSRCPQNHDMVLGTPFWVLVVFFGFSTSVIVFIQIPVAASVFCGGNTYGVFEGMGEGLSVTEAHT